MKPQLKTVRMAKPELSERRERIEKASWRNPNWKFVDIHHHNIDNFRERMKHYERMAKEKDRA